MLMHGKPHCFFHQSTVTILSVIYTYIVHAKDAKLSTCVTNPHMVALAGTWKVFLINSRLVVKTDMNILIFCALATTHTLDLCRRLELHYPQFPSEEDFTHRLLGTGDLQQHSEGGELMLLSRFSMEWPILQAGGLLLPKLVEFYQWLHTQLGMIGGEGRDEMERKGGREECERELEKQGGGRVRGRGRRRSRRGEERRERESTCVSYSVYSKRDCDRN